MKRTSTIAGILAFIFIVCSGVRDTYAWFTSQDTVSNQLSPGNNDVEIDEEFPEEEIIPQEVTTKIVSFENTGTVSCFIRAKYYFSTREAEENIEVIFGSQLWKKCEDGYYYYQKILEPSETTEEFIVGARLKEESSLVSEFNLDIYTETVQSEGSSTPEEAFLSLVC